MVISAYHVNGEQNTRLGMEEANLLRFLAYAAVAIVSITYAGTGIAATALFDTAARTTTLSPSVILAAASFGTNEDCIHPEATCIPNGLVTITYTVTGSGNCSFTADIMWGDESSESHTYTGNITFQHQYTSPGIYPVSVTGFGIPTDANSTCTFTPFSNTYEAPAPSNPVGDFTKSALDMLAALTSKVGADWAKMFATFWTQLQTALDVFNFGRELDEFKNYNDYALAKADSFYETPEGKGNLDAMAQLFYQIDYGSLNQGQRLNIAKAVANQTGATGFLLQKARKASKTGAGIVFQLP